MLFEEVIGKRKRSGKTLATVGCTALGKIWGSFQWWGKRLRSDRGGIRARSGQLAYLNREVGCSGKQAVFRQRTFQALPSAGASRPRL